MRSRQASHCCRAGIIVIERDAPGEGERYAMHSMRQAIAFDRRVWVFSMGGRAAAQDRKTLS
jgi:hypothetical protein